MNLGRSRSGRSVISDRRQLIFVNINISISFWDASYTSISFFLSFVVKALSSSFDELAFKMSFSFLSR